MTLAILVRAGDGRQVADATVTRQSIDTIDDLCACVVYRTV